MARALFNRFDVITTSVFKILAFNAPYKCVVPHSYVLNESFIGKRGPERANVLFH